MRQIPGESSDPTSGHDYGLQILISYHSGMDVSECQILQISKRRTLSVPPVATTFTIRSESSLPSVTGVGPHATHCTNGLCASTAKKLSDISPITVCNGKRTLFQTSACFQIPYAHGVIISSGKKELPARVESECLNPTVMPHLWVGMCLILYGPYKKDQQTHKSPQTLPPQCIPEFDGLIPWTSYHEWNAQRIDLWWLNSRWLDR